MGGFGQSLDIGKELEREKKFEEIKRQQEELTKEEPEKEEEKIDSAEEPAKEPELRLNRQESPAPTADELLKGAESEEEEPASKPVRPSDSTEEDVEAIITRHVLELRSSRSLWALLVAHRMIFITILVLAFSGWLVYQANHHALPAQTAAAPAELQGERVTTLEVNPSLGMPSEEFGVLPLSNADDAAVRILPASSGQPVPSVASVNAVGGAATQPQPSGDLHQILAQGLN